MDINGEYMAKDFFIRNMTLQEMDIAVEWAAAEGWNPGLHDAETFYVTDPNGFFVATLDGKMIACKSAVNYENKFGFMGFYIVKEEFRGSGYGIQIWKHAFNTLSGIPSGMDGVIEQQQNYSKSGYKLAYRQLRFETENIIGKTCGSIATADKISFQELLDYDTKFFPAERKIFLENWIKQRKSLSLVYLNNERLKGYGVIRPCRIGNKIGPLFADNYVIAEELFLALADYAGGQKIFIDIPEINLFAMDFIKKFNMKYVFECGRMYNGNVSIPGSDKIFGNTTFELG